MITITIILLGLMIDVLIYISIKNNQDKNDMLMREHAPRFVDFEYEDYENWYKELIEKNPNVDITEQDEYGIFINTPFYDRYRCERIAFEKNISKEKLDRIPKFIKYIFNAL